MKGMNVKTGRWADFPRAKPEDLPKDCKGCGACCGPMTLFCLPRADIVEKEYLDAERIFNLRGLTFKRVKGYLWVLSPPCMYLNGDHECEIYGEAIRPKECSEYKRGNDHCLAMYQMHRDKVEGRLKNPIGIAIRALKKIVKREGVFSSDKLTHANNTIDNMAEIAEEALKKLGR